MMVLNLYAVMYKESKMINNFWVSSNDKEACAYMVNLLENSYKEIKDEKEKEIFLTKVRETCLVKVGTVDLLEHDMKNDFNILTDLKDFKKDVRKEVIPDDVQ